MVAPSEIIININQIYIIFQINRLNKKKTHLQISFHVREFKKPLAIGLRPFEAKEGSVMAL